MVAYVDVDDTLIRSFGSKRIPMTEMVAFVRSLKQQGATEVFLDLNFDPRVGSPDADAAASMEYAEKVLIEFAPVS